jgi:RNA-directed DNA polymerase
MRNLQRHGIPRDKAHEWSFTRKGSWRLAGSAPLQRALPNAYWSSLGLCGFSASYRSLRSI